MSQNFDEGSVRTRFLARWVFLLILISFVIYVVWTFIPDSRITLAKLKGLNPDQVITKIGQPRYDPRTPPPNGEGWTIAKEPTLGPLKFYYYEYGFEYQLIFESDHVVDVRHAGH